MGASADLAVAVPGLDLEHHAPGVDLEDSRDGTDLAADRSCGEMTDFHVHADADEVIRQMRCKMTDRHLRGHDHGLLRCHADHDVVERIHIFLVRDLDLAVLTALEQLCLCRAPANVGSSNYELGITPGPLSGQLAIVASSTFRC